MMSEQWPITKLGDIISLEYGKPLPKKDRDPEGAFPVYGANGEKARSNKFYHTTPTIIVGRKGSAGELNLTEGKFWPLDVTYFVTFDEEKYEMKFLYYLLQTLNLPSMAKGVKPGINRNDVYALEVRIPPKEEQQRIVSILDEAFDNISNTTEQVEQKLRGCDDLTPSILDSIFLKGKGRWDTQILESLLLENRKISYGVLKPGPHDSNGVRMIKSQQILSNSIDLSKEFMISKENEQKYIRTRLQGGEILLNVVGSVGRSAIAPHEIRGANVSRAVAVLPVEPKLARWIQYNLQSPEIQNFMRLKTGGTAQPVLNLGEVKQIPILVAPPEERLEIIEKLDSVIEQNRQLRLAYTSELESLTELRQSILQEAFSGKLTGGTTA